MMKRNEGSRRARVARAAIILASIVAGIGMLAQLGGGHASRPAARVERAATADRSASPRPVHAPSADTSHTTTTERVEQTDTGVREPSVMARTRARYRSEDLELLAAIARRTNAPASPAVHRLIDAARAGANDAELTRIIRVEVQGALVRHDCFEWLRRRRGDARPKPSTLARARAR